MQIERQSGTGIFIINYKDKEVQEEIKSLLEDNQKYTDYKNDEIKTAIEDLKLGDYKILFKKEGSLITIEVGYKNKLYIDLYLRDIWSFEVIT